MHGFSRDAVNPRGYSPGPYLEGYVIKPRDNAHLKKFSTLFQLISAAVE